MITEGVAVAFRERPAARIECAADEKRVGPVCRPDTRCPPTDVVSRHDRRCARRQELGDVGSGRRLGDAVGRVVRQGSVEDVGRVVVAAPRAR